MDSLVDSRQPESFGYDFGLLESLLDAERSKLGSRLEALLELWFQRHMCELGSDLEVIAEKFRTTAHPAESMARTVWMNFPEINVPDHAARPEFLFPGVSQIAIAGHTLQFPISLPYVDGGFCCSTVVGGAPAPMLSNVAVTTGLTVLLQLPVGSYKVHGIALHNLGDELGVIDALPMSSRGLLITDDGSLDSFLDNLENRTHDLRRRCLLQYESLHDYNVGNKAAQEHSWFVFVVWDSAIKRSQKHRLSNLIRASACHRAGIHFFVIDQDSLEGVDEDWAPLTRLHFGSLGPGDRQLEYLMPRRMGLPLPAEGGYLHYAPLLSRTKQAQIARGMT